ncbi:hypothetical protein [Longimicrobium sp.]|uniref:hypothetical protein n=1 Tax=Longimicrobium sp. TaxID=2029185 RepID=UPI002E2EBE20|nr:hypothetical protein [Longimicrobium sp.]HEX6042168.1 hypothetical protein [Longimicrobium sp.]
MRLAVAAASLAVLTLAAPAPAQPNALQVMRGVVTQLQRNSEGVQDYTLTLRAGALSSDVYVYRDGDEWEVATPDDEEMGDMLEGLVVWPTFGEMEDEFPSEDEVSESDLAELADIINVTQERLEGRTANVLFLRMEGLVSEGGNMPDSLRMYVDPATNQILRVHVAGMAEGMSEMPGGGDVEVTMDFRDYRETDGLTVPRRMRMDLRMEMELTDDQKQMMSAGMEAARAELAQDTSEEGRQTAALMEMFMGLLTEGHMALDVEVADVRVNQGPPSWFEG